jgi:hypothetical protein
MITLQSARKYEELLTGEVEPAPYEYATMFKADGFFARQHAKKRFVLLKGLDAKLRRILRAGERVFYVTSGTTVTIAEHFFVGWMANYLNMRALVFTTERVLLIQIDGGKKKAGELVAQIPYTSLASVKSTWSGACRIKLMDRSEHHFVSVPKADRKFIADFLADIVQGTAAPFGGGARPTGLEHLCPHCFVHVPGHPGACPACTGAFKSPNRAGLLSFIFPGVGDWYLGHRGFAVMEMLSSGFLWLVLVITPLLAPADPEHSINAGYWGTVGLILFAAHGLDAVMTRHFALKGHHPHGPAPAGGMPPLVSPAR